jgi:Acetylornithine deacetylase/Succinyl-diaminopimelate desuccinylase and related deacylases
LGFTAVRACLEERLRVRAGSTDNKGQILAHILGIQETIEEHRELPVNLHLVIEGEEEIGVRISALFSVKIASAEVRRGSYFRYGNDRAWRADHELWPAGVRA